jgi:hypothetical protein
VRINLCKSDHLCVFLDIPSIGEDILTFAPRKKPFFPRGWLPDEDEVARINQVAQAADSLHNLQSKISDSLVEFKAFRQRVDLG